MSAKIEKIYDEKNSELKIIVPIEKDIWKKEQEISFEKLAKKLKIKGYRVGKVPLEVARKNISKTQIWEEAINKLINSAAKTAASQLDEKKDLVLDSPTYSVEKVSDIELEINFLYPIFPNVTIKKFDDYKIAFEQPTKDEISKSVNKQIDDLLSRGTLLLPKEDKDAKVEQGDTIIFDFKGFLGDEAFEGGESEKYELKIGSNTFIPGFEEQLIGKKLGWEGSINVKFPNDYYKDDLKGKDARFDIKIHEIKYNDKQKLDEAFIQTLGIKNVKTEKELNDYLFDLSKRELIEKNRIKFMDEFVKKVSEENDIPAPRAIVLKELQTLMKKFEENLKNQGLTKKEYYEITGYTEEKAKDELKQEAIRSVKKAMVFSLLSKQLEIKATDEDFNRQYQRIGKLYSIDPQMAYMMVKKEQIEPTLLNELLIDKLITTLNPSVKIEKEPVTFVPKKQDDIEMEIKSDSEGNKLKEKENKGDN